MDPDMEDGPLTAEAHKVEVYSRRVAAQQVTQAARLEVPQLRRMIGKQQDGSLTYIGTEKGEHTGVSVPEGSWSHKEEYHRSNCNTYIHGSWHPREQKTTPLLVHLKEAVQAARHHPAKESVASHACYRGAVRCQPAPHGACSCFGFGCGRGTAAEGEAEAAGLEVEEVDCTTRCAHESKVTAGTGRTDLQEGGGWSERVRARDGGEQGRAADDERKEAVT